MAHRRTGIKDLYLDYLDGKSWLCTENIETSAHYWVETKRGTETSEFTCKYCGEIRKWKNSWSRHMDDVCAKTHHSIGYITAQTQAPKREIVLIDETVEPLFGRFRKGYKS